MEGDRFPGLGNGRRSENDQVAQTFKKSFVQAQSILEQNRLLINEISQNHASRSPCKLGRNVGLIRELNDNIRRVVDLYADLSVSFAKSTTEASSSGGDCSGGRPEHKRSRPS